MPCHCPATRLRLAVCRTRTLASLSSLLSCLSLLLSLVTSSAFFVWSPVHRHSPPKFPTTHQPRPFPAHLISSQRPVPLRSPHSLPPSLPRLRIRSTKSDTKKKHYGTPHTTALPLPRIHDNQAGVPVSARSSVKTHPMSRMITLYLIETHNTQHRT